MMLELVFVVFAALISPPAASTVDDDAPICDDGSSAWLSSDGPNWACTRDGCSPHEDACWSEQLAHCHDDGGKDLGVCVFARESCSSRLACFELWLYCAGEYECLESSTIGCTKGTCTTDEASTRDESLVGS